MKPGGGTDHFHLHSDSTWYIVHGFIQSPLLKSAEPQINLREGKEFQALGILHNGSPRKVFSYFSVSVSLLLLSVINTLLSDVAFISSQMNKDIVFKK